MFSKHSLYPIRRLPHSCLLYTSCNYVEAVEGHPCEHIHTDGCYTDQLICGYEEENMEPASDSDTTHKHTKECYDLDCPHERGEHDDCGYKEAVEGLSLIHI